MSEPVQKTYYQIYGTTCLSAGGVRWMIQIWRYQSEQPSGVEELELVSGTGLTVEWKETTKHDVICGSVVTLTLNSPGNGTYMDLYTDSPDEVQLRLYRDGYLYWAGFLDPEFYEEPFSREKNYDVTLTFSDFGILNRLKYDLSGLQTIGDIVSHCLDRMGIGGTNESFGLERDTSLISTKFSLSDESPITLAGLAVMSENFYDEDGEPSTLYEVLEGVLRPLALRIVQRAGKIFIYDINGLHGSGSVSAINWGSDDQILSVDRVYNSVKVTLSTYGDDSLSDKFEYSGKTDAPEYENFDTITPGAPGEHCRSFASDYNTSDSTDVSFRLFVNRTSKAGTLRQSNLHFFKIVPVQGGSEAEGFSYLFYTGKASRHESNWEEDSRSVKRDGYLPGGIAYGGLADYAILYQSNKFYVPSISSERFLRLQMKCLLDVRYNPFTEATTGNEKDALSHLAPTNRLYLPVQIELLDGRDQVLYHYDNRDELDGTGTGYGKWISGDTQAHNHCMLTFDKDAASRKEANINQAGWVDIRQACPLGTTRNARFKNAPAGQYLWAPPVSGWLRITVYAGIQRDATDTVPAGDYPWKNSHDLLRWILFTVPEVVAVNGDALFTPIEPKDVEYTGTLNENAEEALELDEICGSIGGRPFSAKSALFKAATHERLIFLSRAGHLNSPEKLLIGTLFSQYASRHLKLSGTMLTSGQTLCCLTDAAISGKKFMTMGETQSCLTDDSEIVAVEITPDTFNEL